MKDLGIDVEREEGDLDYDMQDQVFYDEEISGAVRMGTNVQLAQSVKTENTDFDKFCSDCEAMLNRKTSILKL